MDKEILKIHFDELLKTEGWHIIVNYIEEKMADSLNRLATVDPKDIEKLIEYQKTIKILNGLKKYVTDNTTKY